MSRPHHKDARIRRCRPYHANSLSRKLSGVVRSVGLDKLLFVLFVFGFFSPRNRERYVLWGVSPEFIPSRGIGIRRMRLETN